MEDELLRLTAEWTGCGSYEQRRGRVTVAEVMGSCEGKLRALRLTTALVALRAFKLDLQAHQLHRRRSVRASSWD